MNGEAMPKTVPKIVIAPVMPVVGTIALESATPLAKANHQFYVSSEWRRLSASILKRRKSCERCGRTRVRLFVDHIVEREDGGALFDEANLQVLCGSCHTKKTNEERAKRMRR